MSKRMIMNAFMQATVSHIIHGMWRHPDMKRDINDLDTWVDLATLFEGARFDAMFFADGLSVHSNFRGSTDIYLREGIGIPNHDPTVISAALAARTQYLGFVFTSSVLQAHPFEFARRLSTLDHLSNGRIGWNIVTTFSPRAFKNFGFDEMVEHDERYRWGEEYTEVVTKLWEKSWSDDALLMDPKRGVSDPAKVQPIDHVGQRYRVAGPHLVSPSPQRTPMLFQAGTSLAGRAFAARWAEGVFLMEASPETAARTTVDIRRKAAEFGREPDDIKFLQAITVVVAPTEEEAWRKDAEIDEYLNLEAMLAMKGAVMGIDLGELPLDTPLIDILDRIPGIRSGAQTVIDAAPPGTTATVADLARLTSRSTRITGSPEQIVDALERWQAAGVDGFNLMFITSPGSFTDFIDLVVPLLQERGHMQREYAPGTLREKMFGGAAHLPDRHAARWRQAETPVS